MARQRTGSVEPWVGADGKTYYRARIHLGDGSRIRHPAPRGMSEARARDWASAVQAKEDRDGLLLAKKLGDHAKVSDALGETFTVYMGRWVTNRKACGVSSVDTEEGYLKKHVVPFLGATSMRSITKAQCEDVRDSIDAKVRAGTIGWKTAKNIWGLVTSLFSDACTSKNRALRILDDNPTSGTLPTDKGDKKAKAYLYPDEFLQLVSCEHVPLRFRRLFCLAVYLYARAGELNALEFGNGIDRKRGIADITMQVDRRTAERRGTKTGLTRRLPIEPNLDPLLAVIEGETRRVTQVSDTDRKLSLTLQRCLRIAGVNRRALHEATATSSKITFHDLRATGITWAAVRGDDPYKLKQRAGHKSFSTTERYIREAENLRDSIGEVFPVLPDSVLQLAINRPQFATERVRMTVKQAYDAVEAPGIEHGTDGRYSANGRAYLAKKVRLSARSGEDKCAIAGPNWPPSGQMDTAPLAGDQNNSLPIGIKDK